MIFADPLDPLHGPPVKSLRIKGTQRDVVSSASDHDKSAKNIVIFGWVVTPRKSPDIGNSLMIFIQMFRETRSP